MGVAHSREAEHRVVGERAGAPLRGPWVESRLAEIAGGDVLLQSEESEQTCAVSRLRQAQSCRRHIGSGLGTSWPAKTSCEPPPADQASRYDARLGGNRLAVAPSQAKQRNGDEVREWRRVWIGRCGWTELWLGVRHGDGPSAMAESKRTRLLSSMQHNACYSSGISGNEIARSPP